MELEIYCRSKAKKAFLKAATTWLAQELRINKLKYSLTVVTKRGLREHQDSNGLAWILEDRKFVIMLDSQLPMDNLVRTLCHEMVHVKQFARGQYKKEVRRGRVLHYWNGQHVRNPKYHESPWEIDAASKESVLALKLNGILSG